MYCKISAPAMHRQLDRNVKKKSVIIFSLSDYFYWPAFLKINATHIFRKPSTADKVQLIATTGNTNQAESNDELVKGK